MSIDQLAKRLSALFIAILALPLLALACGGQATPTQPAQLATPTKAATPTVRVKSTFTPTSTPAPIVSVPVVTGQFPEEAIARLQKAGLAAEKVETPTSSCNRLVMRQEPAMGALVEAGTTVRIFVCVGPTPTPMATSTRANTRTPMATPTRTRAPGATSTPRSTKPPERTATPTAIPPTAPPAVPGADLVAARGGESCVNKFVSVAFPWEEGLDGTERKMYYWDKNWSVYPQYARPNIKLQTAKGICNEENQCEGFRADYCVYVDGNAPPGGTYESILTLVIFSAFPDGGGMHEITEIQILFSWYIQ